MRVQLSRTRARKLFDWYQVAANNVHQLSAIVQNPDHANTQVLDQFLYTSKQTRQYLSFLEEEVKQLYQDAQSSKFYTVFQNNSGGYFINNEHVAEYLIIEAMDEYQFEERLDLITDKYSEFCPCCGERWYSWDDEGKIAPMIYGDPAEDYINSRRNFSNKEAIIYYLDGTTRKITKGGH